MLRCSHIAHLVADVARQGITINCERTFLLESVGLFMSCDPNTMEPLLLLQ